MEEKISGSELPNSRNLNGFTRIFETIFFKLTVSFEFIFFKLSLCTVIGFLERPYAILSKCCQYKYRGVVVQRGTNNFQKPKFSERVTKIPE